MSSLVDLFHEVCRADTGQLSSNIVVCDGDDQWSLAELDSLSDRLAKWFIHRFGAKRGDTIGIFMNKCAFYVLAYTAALKTGCAYLPIDISYPRTFLEDIFDEITPAVVCTIKKYADQLPSGTAIYLFDDEPPPIVEVQLPTVTADDRAYVVYSSGTTGKPKGIECPHRGAVLSYQYRFDAYPYEDNEREACNVFFVWEMFRPILKGVRMYIIPDTVIYDPPLLCKFISENQITRMLFTPSLLEAVLDTQDQPTIKRTFSSLRTIILCGEVVTYVLLQRTLDILPHLKILNLYSVSECHDVAYENLTEFFSAKAARKYAPVGKVIPRVRVAVLDTSDGLRKVPISVAGEIFVGGPTLAIGYIDRPELNKYRFVEVPQELRAELGDRIYRTGDWGYMLSDSSLEICGRCDTLVKIRGYSVEILAVEAAIIDLTYVSACVVLSVGVEGEDKQLAAYIVLKEKMTRKQLRADLKKLLPFFMVPNYFILLERLPVLPASSKVDKSALPAVDPENDYLEAYTLPKTQTEERLAAIWADILARRAVDIQESFFDMGGHSLMAARLLYRIKEEFGIELTMRDLFATPTVSTIAQRIDQQNGQLVTEKRMDLAHEVHIHDYKDNIMDLHLRAFWRSTEWDYRFSRGTILLTGATGFVGSNLLAKLLLASKVQVICLIRETTGATVHSRLESVLTKNGLLSNRLSGLLKSRVKTLAGDITLVHFGLSEEDFLFLTYEVDIVVHAAAYVSLIYPYQALHGINVLGTRNILDFCHQNKVKPLHYISTDAVIPRGSLDADETIDVENSHRKLTDGYSQTKWVAERLVIRSQNRGLPTTIYRLGNQAASFITGVWNKHDFIYLMLVCSMEIKMAPDIDWMMEMSPVDFCASLIANVITKRFYTSVGQIFHLISRDGPKWLQLIDWINKFGIEVQVVPMDKWMKKIAVCEDSNCQKLQKLLQIMVRDETFFTTQSSYQRSNTDKLLTELNLTYPTVDESTFSHWLRILAEYNTIAKPNRKVREKCLMEKVCIVTGASEGIGAAIVQELALKTHMRVVYASRREDKLNELRKKLETEGCTRGNLLPVVCDITKLNEVRNLVDQTIATYGTVDVLVNNAGCMYYQMMKNGPTPEWEQQIDVNCRGTINCIGTVLPHLIDAKSGLIINITSDAGKRGFPGLAIYSGTKFFIEGMSQALRQELVGYGIKVANIQPGDVATELVSRSTDHEALSKYDGSKSGHQILTPSDVARAVLYAIDQPNHVAINEILIEPQAAPI